MKQLLQGTMVYERLHASIQRYCTTSNLGTASLVCLFQVLKTMIKYDQPWNNLSNLVFNILDYSYKQEVSWVYKEPVKWSIKDKTSYKCYSLRVLDTRPTVCNDWNFLYTLSPY